VLVVRSGQPVPGAAEPMTLLQGFHWLPGAEDAPGAILPASTFLDLAPTVGMRSPERMCRIYEKGRPRPELFTQKASAWHQQGCRVVALNEPNLEQEGFNGGPDDYRDWFFSVKAKLPGARLYWAGMSPGVPGWRDWYADAGMSDGIAAHAYGTFDQMRSIVEALLPLGKKLWLAEVNFGAGQTVNRDDWAITHLLPFLDWCSTVPLVEAVCFFAWKWASPDLDLPTPVDGAGTGIEAVLRAWTPPAIHVEAGVGGDAQPVETGVAPGSAILPRVLPPPAATTLGATPMQKRAYLHQFDQLGEASVAEIAATLRLGGVTEIACKTHQELTWLGNATDGDTSPLAFHSLDDVARRHAEFKAEGIRMIPWCVPMGTRIPAEAGRAAEVAHVCDGVIECDTEPYAGFWEGPYPGLEPYTEAILAAGAAYEIDFDARDGGWHPFGTGLFSRVCARAASVSTQSYFGTAGFADDGVAVVTDALAVLDQLEVAVAKRRIILPSFGHEQYGRVAALLAERGVGLVGMWRMGDAGLPVYQALAAIPSTVPTEPDAITTALDGMFALTERLAAIDHREMAVDFQRKIHDLKVALGREAA
jgi:hypothetical protein